MVNKNDLWTMVEPVVEAEGCKLFDIETPSPRLLRIYVSKPAGELTLDDCARVSRRFEDQPGFEEMLPDGCVLEVSSPGVNRKLRRPEHFQGAVGERIKVVAEPRSGAKKQVYVGTLLSFKDGVVEIEDEASKQKVVLPLTEIGKARVDFLFP